MGIIRKILSRENFICTLKKMIIELLFALLRKCKRVVYISKNQLSFYSAIVGVNINSVQTKKKMSIF